MTGKLARKAESQDRQAARALKTSEKSMKRSSPNTPNSTTSIGKTSSPFIHFEHYLLLKDFAKCSLPKDFALEFERVITRPYVDDGEGVYELTELKALLARLVLGVSTSGDD